MRPIKIHKLWNKARDKIKFFCTVEGWGVYVCEFVKCL